MHTVDLGRPERGVKTEHNKLKTEVILVYGKQKR